METSGVSSSSSASTSSGSSASGSQLVDEELFLKLLTTQLQYQDPFEPMDNAEFTTQLAQFSSLDQLYSVNDKLDSFLTNQSAAEMSNAAGLIGKEIKASGSSIELSENSSAQISYDLASDASSVTIDIYNSSGNRVRTVTLGSETSGSQSYAWDGKDDNGNVLDPGVYTIAVGAADINNNTISVSTYIRGTVTGVTFGDTYPNLTVNGTEVSLEHVVEVT
ncbi:MAG: flagellar hook capping FlgD N-terminal domain-containing protein [Nitrospirota bacterium]